MPGGLVLNLLANSDVLPELTEILMTAGTRSAGPARWDPAHHHVIAGLDAGDVTTDFFDHPSALMPTDHGEFTGHVTRPQMFV